MDYLKEYGLTDEEIEEINNELSKNEDCYKTFIYESDKVKEILDLFTSIGVDNLYNIITTSPLMFISSVSYIRDKIIGYENKSELRDLLNENAMNLSILNLY